ncbi:serine protease [Kineobactrum sediminis]|uniref:Serine protease n=1 Tax=Kineobactrum sediminis TaxID=1905677 RepID=A0A2N5Y493_9GAMM|nr:nodulation protein NfeD [Kineobactrum sediminis]PLW83211.1 serine protease [Kineobactrum sediminis]
MRIPINRAGYVARSFLLLWGLLFSLGVSAEVWVIDIGGGIGPATADHLQRSLDKAVEADANLIVLRIDTPGGLDTAMRDMIKAILSSPIPVAGYVAPSGARAASAGTYLLYATHVAAMSPGTNIGAATPVQMGGTPEFPDFPGGEQPGGKQPSGEESSGEQPSGEEPAAAGEDESAQGALKGTAMQRKIINDAVAYIRSLAQMRGRNAEWAERAVREGVSIAAEDALELGVIELLADSVEDLLAQLDGRQVSLADETVTLRTAGQDIHYQAPDWRTGFLSVITDPNVAYVLLLVGIYGLIMEFYNPGVGLPGIVGAVSLLIAMYALQMLPVSYAGIGLILLGVALMVTEAFAPSFGVLGLGGATAFLIGSVMLMDTSLPAFQIALPIIVALTVFSVGLLVFALGLLMKARHASLVSGVEYLIGRTGKVARVDDNHAWVLLDGELWQARADTPLEVDDEVTVTAIDGLTAEVRKQAAGKQPGDAT